LADVVMPGLSGSELVSEIRSIQPGIKVLFVSGYTDSAIVHHGLLDANENFMQKPFTVASLAHNVKRILHA
jgi:two-component system, cell cycle sensor histidine kinase and response regulator CckA